MRKKSDIKIFLAHANEDKEVVLELHDRLKKAGYKPWLDKKNLIPGQNWRSVIPKVIADCQLFIACFSKQSITKKGYIQREFRMALTHAADRPPDSIFLIPIRLDECEIPNLRQEEYGLNLRDLHWLNYWETDGFKGLEKAIVHQYGPFILDDAPNCSEVINTSSSLKLELEEVELRSKRRVNYTKLHDNSAKDFTEDLDNGVTLDMIAIPGGSFMMGSSIGEGYSSEKPQHQVTVKPFFMGKYPVTQAQWKVIASLPKVNRDLKPKPSKFKGNNRPVERISWYDAVEFCKRLCRETGRQYRLNSEAEWEYACRAGTTTAYYFGDIIIEELVNYTGRETASVGQFAPNAFGLYDMHGNVCEWCQDNYQDNYRGAPTDGSAWLWEHDNKKVLRGGSWYHNHLYCRSAYRIRDYPDFMYSYYGFRVACGGART